MVGQQLSNFHQFPDEVKIYRNVKRDQFSRTTLLDWISLDCSCLPAQLHYSADSSRTGSCGLSNLSLAHVSRNCNNLLLRCLWNMSTISVRHDGSGPATGNLWSLSCDVVTDCIWMSFICPTPSVNKNLSRAQWQAV